jgi:hypothetical protein
MGDPDFLIAAFDKAAELEGFDLKSSSPILLMEAANGGWLEA